MSDTAVAEAPAEVHAEAPMTPIEDVFNAALAKAKGEDAKVEVGIKNAEVAETTEKTTEAAPAAKTAPKSALEAALADEPPVETKPTDTLEEFPEKLPNEGRTDHWARARAKMKADSEALRERDTRLQALETKAAEAGKAPPELLAEVARIKAENDQLRDSITAANVELLPEFRAKYIEAPKGLVAKAQEKVKAYGGDPEALAEALRMPEGARRDNALSEAMGPDMSDTARAKVNALVVQYDNLMEEAQAERANSQQSYERFTEKQKAAQAAQSQESETRKKATFEAVTKRLQTEVPTLRLMPPEVAGAVEWNTAVKANMTKAEALFGPDASAEDTVATAIKGQDYDRVVGLLRTSQKDSAALAKQLSDLQGAQPDVRGGSAPQKKGAEALMEKDAGTIFKETLAALTNHED